MTMTEATRSIQNDHRIAQFLGRDPLLNFHILSAYRHDRASVIGLAESGEAVLGVAVASRESAREAPLMRLDAIGPVALRRLLATLRPMPTRLMLHRHWFAETVERAVGPLRVRSSIEVYAVDADYPAARPDPRVAEIRRADLALLMTQPHGWMLDVLHHHLSLGYQAFGLVQDGELIAQACCGYPAAQVEEISHVFTDPARRGRGLAQAAVGAAVAAVQGRGHRAVYYSRSTNMASRRVAEHCGLRHIGSMHEVALST
jgi:GNAT superfamily N-acetyltransferase